MGRAIPPVPPSPSNIKYNAAFSEAGVAKACGLTPTQWYQEPRWSRAAMVAYADGKARVDYWMAEDSKDS